MKKIKEYLILVIFFGGVLVGIQLPGFVDQYGKQLIARVQESERAIDEFRDDADRYFGGDLDKLIAHYAATGDPVFQAGGESIGALVARNRTLTQALQNYRTTWYSPYTQVLFGPVEEIRESVWENYSYTVTFNGSAILVGLAAGLISAIAVELLLFLLTVTAVRVKRRQKVDSAA